MKIGLVCPYSLAHAGGVQECVRAMQRELTMRGNQVTIITPRPRGHADAAPAGSVFIGQSKRIRTPQGTSADIAVSVNRPVIDQVLKTHTFDLIHIHEPLVPFLPWQMLPRITCPVIGTFHAAMPETSLNKVIAGSIGPYVRSVLKRLDAITAVSSAATTYIDNYKHSAVEIIPNGIDLAHYQPLQDLHAELKKNIVYIGRLEARKGVQCLLEAYEVFAAQHSDVSLIIAGNGPDRQKLEKYAIEHTLPRVVFRGFVSEAEKLQLLQEATLFCSPALYGESFGIVLLEAMAANLPIVAGDNPGYRSVLTERGQISLVNPEHSAAFAQKMELLLYDEATRRIWRQWASATIPQYDYPKIVDRYEVAYRRLLSVAASPD